jgi:hypothetical protein
LSQLLFDPRAARIRPKDHNSRAGALLRLSDSPINRSVRRPVRLIWYCYSIIAGASCTISSASPTSPAASTKVKTFRFTKLSASALLPYILFTLVPIPQAGSLPQTIAEKLRLVLEACVAESERGKGVCVRQPGLFQWSVILGGMCAFAAHAQEAATASTRTLPKAYASLARHLSVKPEIRAWSLIASLLGQYLWLESECNELGETFWRHACESGG